MKKLLHIVLYSHIFIGLCAASLLSYNAAFYNQSFPLGYYIFVFTSTVTVYNIHRYVSILKAKSLNISNHRIKIISSFSTYYLYATPLYILVGIYCYWNFHIHVALGLTLPIVITLLYILPILPHRKRLRDISFLKIFCIAITWTVICGVIPQIHFSHLPTQQIIESSVENFLFLFALTLPFDFRDRNIERKLRTKTLVSILGPRNSRTIALSYLVIGFGLFLMKINSQQDLRTTIILILFVGAAYCITGRYISKGFKFKKNDSYYTFKLDGMLILLYISVSLTCLLEKTVRYLF